jgi:branched-chain amino acid transport system ATP-binding protein
MAYLLLDSINVSYGNIKALKGVSLSVDEGDTACLIGANGAGKSTLLKAIVGLEPLTEGSIQFKDNIIASTEKSKTLSTEEIIKNGIALVPEGRRVFADLTVQENLEMGAFLIRDEKYIKDKQEEMFELFPILGSRRKQKAQSLSGGEQQMLAIARALMSNPRLLLLDEPGLGLAPLIIKHIFQIIKKINEQDKVTVFLVEQNAKIALEASSKAYVMETGNIVLEGPSSELLHNSKVRQAYLGE